MPERSAADTPTVRSVMRVVVTVVLSALALVVIYAVRTPLGYIALALFLAVCAAGPIALLSRHTGRGMAIAIVYVVIAISPVVIGAVLIPPLVNQTTAFFKTLPQHISDLEQTMDSNPQLKKLNENFHITDKLQSATHSTNTSLKPAAQRLAAIGEGVISAIFVLVEILVLSIFMVARGRRWIEAGLRTRPPPQADALRTALDGMASAVGGYVRGAIIQAFLAGLSAYLVLLILGVPAALACGVLMMLFDPIPLVGATIGAVLVGVVTLTGDFPLDTIVWAIFAIIYQQFENYVIQPRIQSHQVSLDPFLVVVAALFGAALAGIPGALLAIPVAGAIQVAILAYLDYRHLMGADEPTEITPTG